MKRVLALLAPAALFALIAAPSPVRAQAGPYVYRTSLRINTKKSLVYWQNPNAAEPIYNHTSWLPRCQFNLAGPLEGGSQVSVQFLKPNGAVWLNENLDTPETDGDSFASFTFDPVQMEKKAIIETGLFTLNINLSNALANTRKTLYTAKFTVGKFPYAAKTPANKNNFEFYVNHDWNLPIGQMYFESKVDENAPRLRVHLWFRGPWKAEKLAAYLFYKGKQVFSTKQPQGGVDQSVAIETGSNDDPDKMWRRFTFFMDFVAMEWKNAQEPPEGFVQLAKNPGEYELKVLADGKLARTLKFTVGADGKLVDDLAPKNNAGYGVMLFPVKVEPGIDGGADVTNYKQQAYYGNPLVGFP